MNIRKCGGVCPGGRIPFALALACLMTAAVALTAARAENQETFLVTETVGTVPVKNIDPSAAIQLAVTNALERAVDEGIRRVLPSDILTGNFEEITGLFYGKEKDFILSYTTLAVARGETYCRALVRASIAINNINDKIRQSGIRMDSRRPRLLLLLSEERDGRPPVYWWGRQTAPVITTTEKTMAENFAEKGITVVSHEQPAPDMAAAGYTAELTDQAALAIGRSVGADFVITGRSAAVFPDTVRPGKNDAVPGFLEARLLDISTGERVSQVSLQRQPESAAAPADATVALIAAASAAALEFTPALMTAFEQREAEPPKTLVLRIQGRAYMAGLGRFQIALEAVEGISRSRIMEMKIDEAILNVDFSGTARELADALGGTSADQLRINILDVRRDGLTIELTAAGMVAK